VLNKFITILLSSELLLQSFASLPLENVVERSFLFG